jgi:hypothetical protein
MSVPLTVIVFRFIAIEIVGSELDARALVAIAVPPVSPYAAPATALIAAISVAVRFTANPLLLLTDSGRNLGGVRS